MLVSRKLNRRSFMASAGSERAQPGSGAAVPVRELGKPAR
jgi:hypothetical protein